MFNTTHQMLFKKLTFSYSDQLDQFEAEFDGFSPNFEYNAVLGQSYLGNGANQFGIASNPNIVSSIHNNGYNNEYDNILIGVVSILFAILICLICIGIYSMVGVGCYMYGKSQRNNRHNETDKDAGYQVKCRSECS